MPRILTCQGSRFVFHKDRLDGKNNVHKMFLKNKTIRGYELRVSRRRWVHSKILQGKISSNTEYLH